MTFVLLYSPLISSAIAFLVVAWASVSTQEKACTKFKEVYYQVMTLTLMTTTVLQFWWLADEQSVGEHLNITWALAETALYALITTEAYFHIRYKCCTFCNKLKRLGVINK